jgi:hypothetical protein
MTVRQWVGDTTAVTSQAQYSGDSGDSTIVTEVAVG